MKKQYVYLVCAETDHESSSVVRALTDPAAAEELAQRCRDHERKCPAGPNVIEDTPENDALHAKWQAAHTRWAKRHPAGKNNASCDQYLVRKIELDPRPPTATCVQSTAR